MPRCPFCKTPSLWKYARKMGFTLSSIRYHFRCPNCMSIISTPTITLDRGILDVDLISFLVKRVTSKKFRVESVGKNEKLQHFVDEEYTLETLQQWSSGK